MVEIGVALYEDLSSSMSADLAGERLRTVARFAIQTSADRARRVDDPADVQLLLPPDELVDNLVDMAYGALFSRRGGI